MLVSTLLLLFPALMAFAAASDLLTMTIPNRLTLGVVAAFAAFAVATGMPLSDVAWHLAAGALVLGVTFAMFAFGWIGGGDAKLAAAIALWFGFAPLFDFLLLASIGGGALTLLIIALRQLPLPSFALSWSWLDRLHDRKSGVPYGIALAGAAMIVYPESPLWAALAAL
jgi:prepilin peptidase CpaA